MTKKQGKLKKEKKAVNPVKPVRPSGGKTAVSKSKPAKVVKSGKSARPSGGKTTKPAGKPGAKTAVKKVEIKRVVKKAVAPAKKNPAPEKMVKPAKPVAKAGKATIAKLTNKPVKPTAKAAKEKEKELKKNKKKDEAGKTITLVVPVKKKASKEEKPAKAAAKKEGSKKEKVTEKPSGKKKKNNDNEEDVEIVDLWETVEEDEEIEVEPTKPVAKGKGGRKPKSQSDDDEPVIENDILIEQLIQSTKKLKKPSSKVPQQIRTFTNPMASLTVAKTVETRKAAAKKEPKGKFELEYVIRTSAPVLYEFLTSPSGLSEWFADDVNIHEGVFTFFWDGSEQKARLLGFKDDRYIKLQWLDKPDGTYFEFRIERDELTGDVSLIVTDFADEASDMQTSKLLWDSQVNKLSQVIGSYS